MGGVTSLSGNSESGLKILCKPVFPRAKNRQSWPHKSHRDTRILITISARLCSPIINLDSLHNDPFCLTQLNESAPGLAPCFAKGLHLPFHTCHNEPIILFR